LPFFVLATMPKTPFTPKITEKPAIAIASGGVDEPVARERK